MARKRQLTIEERQTIITLKNEGLSYRDIAKKVKIQDSRPLFVTNTIIHGITCSEMCFIPVSHRNNKNKNNKNKTHRNKNIYEYIYKHTE